MQQCIVGYQNIVQFEEYKISVIDIGFFHIERIKQKLIWEFKYIRLKT